MNWSNTFKSSSTTDNSPELKKGEIKAILIHVASKTCSDFEFLSYKNGCYTFQRVRKINQLNIYETFHIIFALKDKNFACSIASRLNPMHIYNNSYNNGIINPHIDLIVLKKGNGILPINEAYYFHNGKVETTTRIVEQIFQDFITFGVSFIDKQFSRLTNDEIIKAGFQYIEKLNIDKEQLKKGIENQLFQGGLLISSIKHPIYLDLKEFLHSITGLSKEDKQLIPKTTYELLELYWTKD